MAVPEKAPGHEAARRSQRISEYDLQRIHVLRLRTFLTLGDIHGHLLAFHQRSSSRTINGAEMNENIFAAFLLNETETFLVIEPLHSTCYLI